MTDLSDQDLPDARRRRFVNWLLGSSVAALFASVIYPVLRFLSPPRVPEATANQVEAGPVNDPDLLSKGFKIVRFGAEPVILIRVGERDFRAFSATCTHLACIVEYQRDQQRIYCNCHGGRYDLNGRNAGGPPPRPLTPFKVSLVAKGGAAPDAIVISRV